MPVYSHSLHVDTQRRAEGSPPAASSTAFCAPTQPVVVWSSSRCKIDRYVGGVVVSWCTTSVECFGCRAERRQVTAPTLLPTTTSSSVVPYYYYSVLLLWCLVRFKIFHVHNSSLPTTLQVFFWGGRLDAKKLLLLDGPDIIILLSSMSKNSLRSPVQQPYHRRVLLRSTHVYMHIYNALTMFDSSYFVHICGNIYLWETCSNHFIYPDVEKNNDATHRCCRCRCISRRARERQRDSERETATKTLIRSLLHYNSIHAPRR